MGKPARARVLADTQAQAIGREHPHQPAQAQSGGAVDPRQVGGSGADELTFSPKRVAQDVKKVLQSAIANAENNHDLDVDDLVVTEA